MGTTITEKDITKLIKDISLRGWVKPRDKKTGKFLKGPLINTNKDTEYVVMCGQGFKDVFDKAMNKELNKINGKN